MQTLYKFGQTETGYGCLAYGESNAYSECNETIGTNDPVLADTGQTIIVSTAFSLFILGLSIYLLLKTTKKGRNKK